MPEAGLIAQLASDTPLSPEAVARVVQGLGGAAYCWSTGDDSLQWSANVAAGLGFERIEQISSGADYASFIEAGSGTGRHDAAQRAPVRDGKGRVFETVYCLVLPPGTEPRRLWVEDRGVGYFDDNGRLEHVQGIVRRLATTEALKSANGAEQQADRQRLARILEDRLTDTYAEGGEFGFVLVALDRLGQLNDAYGFHVADEVIDIVWQRLRARLGEGEEIARFSGSKFGIILRHWPHEGLAGAAERFVTAVNDTPPRTSAGAVAAHVSAGGLIAPRQGRNVAEIFAHAQDALQSARTSARGTFTSYTPSFDRAAERRSNLRFADDIVSALGDDRVTLAFQPIANSVSRDVAFHECLVRINGRDGRVFDGSAIIPTAERFGLTRLIDRRTLELAFSALDAEPDLRLSVNVSPTTIHDGVWMHLLEQNARRGLCERLIIELTETTSIADLESVRRSVHWLHGLGCKVAMDDFGVGYTSFRNLRRLGVDMLKIDGSFISTLMQSHDDRHFVRALLDLARNLDIETVAEWVLDEATAQQLVEWGCTYLQGELIGLATEKPLPTGSF